MHRGGGIDDGIPVHLRALDDGVDHDEDTGRHRG